MNWKRGFFRIWIAGSILWGILVTLKWSKELIEVEPYAIETYLRDLLMPPVVLLVLWIAGAMVVSWVGRGFKSND